MKIYYSALFIGVVEITTIVLLLNSLAYSQNSLSGRITDQDSREPLSGAVVYFPDLKTGASADAHGDYSIKKLPAGKFLLEVKFLGYTSVINKIEITGATYLDFQLEPAHIEIREVVVTGVSTSTDRKLNPMPVMAVKSVDFRLHSFTNIVDAFARKPGISQITTGSSISKPVIRGLGYNRVVTLFNGFRQEGQQWGDEHGVEIDENSVQRVEIVKGPGSLMYGSDGLAGVLNLIPPPPAEPGTVKGQLLLNYQVNNNLQAYSLMNEGNQRNIFWNGQITTKKAGSFTTPYDGKVYNSGFEEMNGSGFAGITRKWGFSQIAASSFHLKTGMIEGDRDSTGTFQKWVALNDSADGIEPVTPYDLYRYGIEVPYQKVSHVRVNSTNNIITGGSSLRMNAAFQQNIRNEFSNVLDKDEPVLAMRLSTVNYDLKYVFPENNGTEIVSGINGIFQENNNYGSEFLVPDYTIADGGIFTTLKQEIRNIHLQGGMRYDKRRLKTHELFLDSSGVAVSAITGEGTVLKFPGTLKTFTSPSASMGMSIVKGKITCKVNIARGFRAPNIAELASNGIHEGTFRYETGNKDLEPETATQLDIGILYESDHIAIDAASFYNSIHHFIYLRKAGNGISGAGNVPTFTYTQGNALLRGGEVSLDMHLHPLDWLHFENSFSFVDAQLVDAPAYPAGRPDGMRYIPFTPPPRFQSELRADIKKIKKIFRNCYVKIEFDYNFEKKNIFTAYGTETPTPSYLLCNIGAGFTLVEKSRQLSDSAIALPPKAVKEILSVYVSANNIFDTPYQDHLSRLKYAPVNPLSGRRGIFNMGRNISVKVIIPLEIVRKQDSRQHQ